MFLKLYVNGSVPYGAFCNLSFFLFLFFFFFFLALCLVSLIHQGKFAEVI